MTGMDWESAASAVSTSSHFGGGGVGVGDCAYDCACEGDGDCVTNGPFGPDYPEIPSGGDDGEGPDDRLGA
jgi:hypothetical protein